jgi:hypothetical protein
MFFRQCLAWKRANNCDGKMDENSSVSEEEHVQRNRKNECPATEPTPGVPDSRGRNWREDNPMGEDLFHGGLDCYRWGKFQCCYDDNGDVVTSGGDEGTYDYTPHQPGDGEPSDSEGTGSHFKDDVWTHWVYGNCYEPDVTEVYELQKEIRE